MVTDYGYNGKRIYCLGRMYDFADLKWNFTPWSPYLLKYISLLLLY